MGSGIARFDWRREPRFCTSPAVGLFVPRILCQQARSIEVARQLVLLLAGPNGRKSPLRPMFIAVRNILGQKFLRKNCGGAMVPPAGFAALTKPISILQSLPRRRARASRFARLPGPAH
jgi:hypothetical protein